LVGKKLEEDIADWGLLIADCGPLVENGLAVSLRLKPESKDRTMKCWTALLCLIPAMCLADPPAVKSPTPFNTPEADKIVSQMQVFPKDNAWNADVSKWPLHPNSDKIVASVGRDKPLRYNPDMAYVLVPANQKKIDLVKLEYVDESDKGPGRRPSRRYSI
jgi:hypothetical protein